MVVDHAEGYISIHAPREGSDGEDTYPIILPYIFQSTLPVRGATMLSCIEADILQFQSTLPVRGATCIVHTVCPR